MDPYFAGLLNEASRGLPKEPVTRYIKSDLVNQSDAGERKERSMGLADKAKDFLQSDQAEEKSDQVLDKAEELAKKALGNE